MLHFVSPEHGAAQLASMSQSKSCMCVGFGAACGNWFYSQVSSSCTCAGEVLAVEMAANGRVSGTGPPVVDKDYLAAVEGAKKDVEALLEQTKCVPLFLRLAFHDAMTYDSNTRTGGANGSIRVQRELEHAGNENLSTAIELLEPIKAKFAILTYAGDMPSDLAITL